MDLLFKEYASPFSLLDEVIKNGRFCDFLDTFDEQRLERSIWEYYLHKIGMWDDISFDDFRKKILNGNPLGRPMTKPSNELIEKTIRHSFDIMNDFEI